MSTIVAGVDFGTLSVRLSLFDSERGRLGSATAEYPLKRKKDNPDFATQSHADHMKALALAARAALESSGVNGKNVAAIALDTTGSSVIPVGEGLAPLDDYYLWCDHRAWKEAARLTEVARTTKLPAIEWCGGVYSSEWGFAKLLHWMRHNPEKRQQLVAAFEHCDMVAAVLCDIQDPREAPRSICAMGHKWLWNKSLGGFPTNDFFREVDPLLSGVTEKLQGRRHIGFNRRIVSPVNEWALAREFQFSSARRRALGYHRRGARFMTSNVIILQRMIGITDSTRLCRLCVVPSVDPRYTGMEAGLSATGDISRCHRERAGISLAEMSKGIENYRRRNRTAASHMDNGSVR
jgi:L-ribulokinase